MLSAQTEHTTVASRWAQMRHVKALDVSQSCQRRSSPSMCSARWQAKHKSRSSTVHLFFFFNHSSKQAEHAKLQTSSGRRPWRCFVCMQQWCCCLPTRPCPRPPQVGDFGYRPVFVSFSFDVLLCISPPQYISRIRKAPRVPAAGELRLARGASHVACRLFVLPHPAPGVVKVRLRFRQRRRGE